MPKIRSSGIITLIIGLSVYVLYIYYIGFDEVLKTLSNIGFLEISLFIILTIFVIFLHSFTWYLLIKEYSTESKITFKNIFGIVVIALFSGYVVPVGAVTEVMRITLSIIKYKIRSSVAIASVIIHRLYISSSALILFFIIFTLRAYLKGIYSLSYGELIIVSAYMILVVSPNLSILGFMSTGIFKKILDRVKQFIEKKVVRRRTTFDPEIFVRDHIIYVRKSLFSINTILTYIVSIAEWFFLSLAVYVLMYGFVGKLEDPLYSVMSAIVFQMIYWIMPLSFIGSLGIADFILTLSLQVIGLTPHLATSLVILYRTMTFLVILILYYPITRISKIENLDKLVKEGINMIYGKNT